MLGEMKGRNNDKPIEKYHPYIVALLKQPFIKGIVGGGYAPENNFSLADLPDDQTEALVKMKPSLADLATSYKLFGMNNDTLIKLHEVYVQKYGEMYVKGMTYNEKTKVINMVTNDTPSELVRLLNNRDLPHYIKLLDGDGTDDFEVSNSEAKQAVDNLSRKTHEIAIPLMRNHVDADKWDDEQDDEPMTPETIEQLSPKELYDVITDEAQWAIQNGITDGYMLGTKSAIETAVKDFLEYPTENDDVWFSFNYVMQDEPVVAHMNAEYLIELLTSNDDAITSTAWGDIIEIDGTKKFGPRIENEYDRDGAEARMIERLQEL
jgi:hypothetical protein